MYKNQVIGVIKEFVHKNHRIPFKRELYKHYRAARRGFGTWNKAIKSAGYNPNPIRFATKYVANDGHRCDSLSEKIIDDWLYSQNITHRVKVPYPWDNGMTADFKIGDYWIELFGLSGQLSSYDLLKEKKITLIESYKLKFIYLKPQDVYSTTILYSKLKPALQNSYELL